MRKSVKGKTISTIVYFCYIKTIQWTPTIPWIRFVKALIITKRRWTFSGLTHNEWVITLDVGRWVSERLSHYTLQLTNPTHIIYLWEISMSGNVILKIKKISLLYTSCIRVSFDKHNYKIKNYKFNPKRDFTTN